MTSTFTIKAPFVAVASDQTLAPSTAYVEDTMLSSAPITLTTMLLVLNAPKTVDEGVRTVKLQNRGGTVSTVHGSIELDPATFPGKHVS
jgi:hypothetical protein